MISADYFYNLSDKLFTDLKNEEVLLCYLRGEQSDFVRFNHAKVRQVGRVDQARLRVELIIQQKHIAVECDIGGETSQDLSLCNDLLGRLRQQISQIDEDPYFIYQQTSVDSFNTDNCSALDSAGMVDAITRLSAKTDLVGLLSSGPIFFGFSNSLGQRNWFHRISFNFDWSIYKDSQAAIKSSYVGNEWNDGHYSQKLEQAQHDLALQLLPRVTVKPGRYRVFLAPQALYELFQSLGANAFSSKSHRTCGSCLKKLNEGFLHFSPQVNLIENHRDSLAPMFTPQGFIKPQTVSLISEGRQAGSLTNSRTAAEYHLQPNCTTEVPETLTMSAGQLDINNALSALDDGLFISNLWYTNFSDINHCRITGMTRFACFKVTAGKVVAPLEAMRFDQSMYRLLGSNLEALTHQQEWIYSAETYRHRSTQSMYLPGLLARDFELTL